MTEIRKFLNTEIESVNRNDVDNSNFIWDLIPNNFYDITLIGYPIRVDDLVKQVTKSINMYSDITLINKLKNEKENIKVSFKNNFPFVFRTKIGVAPQGITSEIVCPSILDYASYPFFGNSIHHSLKDVNPDERKYKKKYAEVIPFFYELVVASKEESEIIKREILSRRINLLLMDKTNDNGDILIQHYNSMYYALLLYNKYKEDPVNTLHIVSRVLKNDISTFDLLKLLDIYNGNEIIVKDEFNKVKEYIKNN